MFAGVIMVAVPFSEFDNKFKIPLLFIEELTVSCLPALTVNEEPVPIVKFEIALLSLRVIPPVLLAVNEFIIFAVGNSVPLVDAPL
jgi:hypothetical protein